MSEQEKNAVTKLMDENENLRTQRKKITKKMYANRIKVGQHLRNQVKQTGLSKVFIAEKIGMPYQTLLLILSGKQTKGSEKVYSFVSSFSEYINKFSV